jgi:hypothetical protein
MIPSVLPAFLQFRLLIQTFGLTFPEAHTTFLFALCRFVTIHVVPSILDSSFVSLVKRLVTQIRQV